MTANIPKTPLGMQTTSGSGGSGSGGSGSATAASRVHAAQRHVGFAAGQSMVSMSDAPSTPAASTAALFSAAAAPQMAPYHPRLRDVRREPNLFGETDDPVADPNYAISDDGESSGDDSHSESDEMAKSASLPMTVDGGGSGSATTSVKPPMGLLAAAALTPASNAMTPTQELHAMMNAGAMAPTAKPAPRQFITEQNYQRFDKSRRGSPVALTSEYFIDHRSEDQVRRRTVNVQGLVEPTATKGRDNAPESQSGYQASQNAAGTSKLGSSGAAHASRNTGNPQVQKGHVFALQLGGPDIDSNICPQWGNWQANGEWKLMENGLKRRAEALPKKHRLMVSISPIYKGDANAAIVSFDAQAFPSAFRVEAWTVGDKGVPLPGSYFDHTFDHAQNATDDMMMYRKDDEAERFVGDDEDLDPEHVSYVASDLKGQRKKTEKRSYEGRGDVPADALLNPIARIKAREQMAQSAASAASAASASAAAPPTTAPTTAAAGSASKAPKK